MPRRRTSIESTMEVQCGFCGEPWTLIVDPTAGTTQAYVEDCPVCCRPNEIRLDLSSDDPHGNVSYEG